MASGSLKGKEILQKCRMALKKESEKWLLKRQTSLYSLLSATRATVTTQISRAPAISRALAHSVTVVPVVRTSSTRKIRLPRIAKGLLTAKAALRFFLLATPSRVVCGGVLRVRIKTSASRVSSACGKKILASSNDWLSPRFFSRVEKSGTGTTRSVSRWNSCLSTSLKGARTWIRAGSARVSEAYFNRWRR